MTPDELSRRLRLLADRIDSSDRPSASRVAAEMRTLMQQVDDASSSSRHGPEGRRRSPAVASPVDVTDEAAFRAAIRRTASISVPAVPDYQS